ncbi:MAG: plasmid mobilization relaxosome protein MobC [Prochloraceae cyanobacterium]
MLPSSFIFLATDLSISEFIRCTASSKQIRTYPHLIPVYNILREIRTELKRIGVNVNQIAAACNTSVKLGEPVVVDRGLLESNQKIVKQAVTEVETAIGRLFE